MAFRYIDAEGNVTAITDSDELDFYRVDFTENGDPVIGEKMDPSEFSIKWQDTSTVGFLDYAGSDEWIQAVVGCKGYVPTDPGMSTIVEFTPGPDQGFFTKDTSKGNLAKFITANETKASTIYFAYGDEGGEIESVDEKSVDLDFHDENGNVLTLKLKVEPTTFTFDEPGSSSTVCAYKITIPKNVLKTNAKMTLHFFVNRKNGDYEDRNFDFFVRYQAPKKGTKLTVSGVTYKVTGDNTVSVNKVKTSAKKVTIPAKIYGKFKITAIDAKAMKGCKKLKTITVKSKTIKKVGKKAFDGVPKKAKASVPKAKKKAYKKLFKKGGFKGTVK